MHAKNESHRTPSLNLQMGHAYLSATDPFVLKRDWQWVFDEAIKGKQGPTQRRWKIAAKDQAIAAILKQPLAPHLKPENLPPSCAWHGQHQRLSAAGAESARWTWAGCRCRSCPGGNAESEAQGRTRRHVGETPAGSLPAETNPERWDFYRMCWLFRRRANGHGFIACR